MRGVESSGMLCSAKELGLAEESGGLLVARRPMRRWVPHCAIICSSDDGC